MINSRFSQIVLLAIILFSLTQCTVKEKDNNLLSIIKSASENPGNPFYLDKNLYSASQSSMPIGVFDSGTGGLAVLEAILTLDEFDNETHLPGSDSIPDFISESFTYLADEANMPYGRYDAEGRAEFLRELVVKDVIFLSGNRYYASPGDKEAVFDKLPVKEIVIACNTATAYGLETVKEASQTWGLPVEITGIIEAGAQTALDIVSKKKPGGKALIAVLATEGTCSSGGYPRTILNEASRLAPDMDLKIIQQPGIGLAGAIDGDINYINPDANSVRSPSEYFGPGLQNKDYPLKQERISDYNFNGEKNILLSTSNKGDTLEVQLNSVKSYVNYMISGLVQKVAISYPDRKIDVVILGCTHYPYVEDEIRSHFAYLKRKNQYSSVIPDSIVLIDPARSLATILYTKLVDKKLLGNNSINNSKFYISVPNKHLPENIIDANMEFPFDWKYGRRENTGHQFVKIVPFSDAVIDPGIINRIKEQLPATYNLIK